MARVSLSVTIAREVLLQQDRAAAELMDKTEIMQITSTARCVKAAPNHFVQMDSLGLQQLEHLEKELEQAKQKVIFRFI